MIINNIPPTTIIIIIKVNKFCFKSNILIIDFKNNIASVNSAIINSIPQQIKVIHNNTQIKNDIKSNYLKFYMNFVIYLFKFCC